MPVLRRGLGGSWGGSRGGHRSDDGSRGGSTVGGAARLEGDFGEFLGGIEFIAGGAVVVAGAGDAGLEQIAGAAASGDGNLALAAGGVGFIVLDEPRSPDLNMNICDPDYRNRHMLEVGLAFEASCSQAPSAAICSELRQAGGHRIRQLSECRRSLSLPFTSFPRSSTRLPRGDLIGHPRHVRIV